MRQGLRQQRLTFPGHGRDDRTHFTRACLSPAIVKHTLKSTYFTKETVLTRGRGKGGGGGGGGGGTEPKSPTSPQPYQFSQSD